jgi:carbon-monoxide dehydrogenase small subunit
MNDTASPKGQITVTLQLNGHPVQVDCRPDTRLLTLLREHWGLTGAKPGCEVGAAAPAWCGWTMRRPMPAC